MDEQPKTSGVRLPLAEAMSITCGWVMLRATWNENAKDYVYEQSTDGENWVPEVGDCNVVTCRYVGGPKDGRVEC